MPIAARYGFSTFVAGTTLLPYCTSLLLHFIANSSDKHHNHPSVMRSLAAVAALAAAFVNITRAQQYAGDVIPNSLSTVPGSEITYFRINDPSGKNKNLTLTNYYSHGKIATKRLVEANVQRAVVIVHGLNRDPGTYMSNMLSALAQVKSDPNVNLDTVAIMAPYFPNGDDKTLGYPWTDGLSAGKGSTSNALVWKASQWSQVSHVPLH